MQLTGKQIAKEGIITGYDTEIAVQQQGIDLRVIKINALEGAGKVPSGKAKTDLPKYRPVTLASKEEHKNPFWYLLPGYYEVEFAEGCNIPNNRAMTFIQRSSLLRCGAIIRSSQFDAGFKTDRMGTFMQVFNPIIIEYNARIAQTIVVETAEVDAEDLYSGQWQNDIQRENKNDKSETRVEENPEDGVKDINALKGSIDDIGTYLEQVKEALSNVKNFSNKLSGD